MPAMIISIQSCAAVILANVITYPLGTQLIRDRCDAYPVFGRRWDQGRL